MFNTVNDKSENSELFAKLTANEISDEMKFTTSAFAYQTPVRKRKHETTNFLDELKLPPFKRHFNESNKTSDLPVEDIRRLLDTQEENINDLFLSFAMLKDLLAKEKTSSDMTALATYVKLGHLVKSLGDKPQSLDAAFEAPNIWLSIGNVASHISKIYKTISDPTEIMEAVNREILAFKTTYNKELKYVHQRVNPIGDNLVKLESAFVQICRQLGKNFMLKQRDLIKRNSILKT